MFPRYCVNPVDCTIWVLARSRRSSEQKRTVPWRFSTNTSLFRRRAMRTYRTCIHQDLSALQANQDLATYWKHATNPNPNPNPNADSNSLWFPESLLGFGEGLIYSDKEELVTLLSSIALEIDVRGFCRAIFSGTENNYMFDDWLTKQEILIMRNTKLEESNTIAKVYIPGEIWSFKR